MNLIEQMNVLKGLDDTMLQQQVQAGTVPPYLVLSEMNRRKDMRARYEGELARRKPQTTVTEDLMGGLQPGGPMAAAPAIDPAAMGSGSGIAAAAAAPGGPGFAEGGIVSAVPGYKIGGPVDIEAIYQRYNDKLSGLDEDRDRARALALIAASAGMLSGGSSNTLKNVGLGINAGVQSYGDAINTIDSRETDLLRNLTDLDLTQQDKAFREREFAYRQANDAAERERLANANRDKFSPTITFGVDENGDRVSAWKNITTGEYKIDPRPDGTMPKTFVPYSADELTAQREQAKVDVTKAKQMPNEQMGVENSLRQASIAMDTIKEAFNSLNWSNTGTIGNIGAAIPGGWSTNSRALIKTLQSGTAARALNAMREASKNGGALGNTSNADIELLQTSIANLDPTQGEEALKRQLQTIYEDLQGALAVRVKAFESYYANTPGVEVPELVQPPPTFEEFMSVDVENDPMDSLVDKYRTQ